MRHLLLRIKISDAAQAAHYHLKIILIHKIRQQSLTCVHLDIRKMRGNLADHIHTLFKREQGLFFEIHHNADGKLIKYLRSSLNDI